MKQRIIFLISVILFYTYIYSPALQIMSYGLDKVIFVIALIYLFCQGKFSPYLRSFKQELIMLAIITVVSFCISAVHGTGNTGIATYDAFNLIECLIVPYALCLFCYKSNIDLRHVMLCCATVAGLISVYLLLNPGLAEVMKNNILRIPEHLTKHFYFRGFGFADGLTFAYPVTQGFILAFILTSYKLKNSLFYLMFIPILISILVNARSGLIPIFIAVLVILFFSSLKRKLKFIFGGIAVILVFFIMLSSISSDSQLGESVEWGLSTFSILQDIINGNDAENMDALTDEMVQIPHDLATWLMGTGANLSGNSYRGYSDSDIGFCIRLVYGGIFYVALWFILCRSMFKRLLRIDKYYCYVLFFSLLFLNWKSDFFVVNPSSRFFYFIYVYLLFAYKHLTNETSLYRLSSNA